ncbi:MAG: adenylate cyclase [Thermoleophilaceae bacterium]|nr:adenylate cyclase [Thermoleophilaceae bacterium]
MTEIDFEREGLLAGCKDEEAKASRLALLERLADRGVSLEELKQAVEEERLVLLPVELELSGTPKYSAEQVAELAEVDYQLLEDNWRALGMTVISPTEISFTEEDLEAAKRVRMFLQGGLPEEGVIDTARVIGQAMSRVAAATRDMVGPALLQAGDSELDLAERYAQAGAVMPPLLMDVLAHQYRRHLLEGIRRDVITQGERESGASSNARVVTAAFADLCGFTRLGETLPVGDLGRLASRLAKLAAEVIEPPVTIIKTIGDAVMMVSDEPEPMLAAALELVARAEAEEDFPELKAGLALGPAVPRAGDWYGHSINLSARITQVARPSSVLASQEVKDAVGKDGYEWSYAGERKLKGIEGGTKLFRARVATEEPA